MKLNIELFITGLIQVILVCLNTYQIAVFAKNPSIIVGIGITIIGFLISMIWTFNVKKVAFGNWYNRISYASGAACGSILGTVLGYLIYKI